MRSIENEVVIKRHNELVSRMMLTQEDERCEFNREWVQRHGWKVVPTEPMARLPVSEIPRLVDVLRKAGYTDCIVVATENLGNMASHYALSVEIDDFREFNRQLGAFRSVITTEEPTWAISCTESYNLFAAEKDLLGALLGKPIEQAREDFVEFASLLAKGDSGDPLLEVARRYAGL